MWNRDNDIWYMYVFGFLAVDSPVDTQFHMGTIKTYTMLNRNVSNKYAKQCICTAASHANYQNQFGFSELAWLNHISIHKKKRTVAGALPNYRADRKSVV